MICALLLLVTAFCFRAHLLFVRYFDRDELEHLQASFLISRGLVPYRDFCENHLPLYYYLLRLLFYLSTEVKILFYARAVSLILLSLSFFLFYDLAKKLYSTGVSLWATVWLAYNFTFLWRTLEIRPLLPAFFFLFLGFKLLITGLNNGKNWYGGWAGFFLGLAFLSTQKIAFLILGLPCFMIYQMIMIALKRSGKNYRAYFSLAGWLAGGFLIPLILCIIYFSSQKALPDLIYRNFIMAILWKRRFPAFIHMKTLVFFNPVFTFWGLAGFLIISWSIIRGKIIRYGTSLIYFATLSTLAGLHLNPVIYPQYISLFIPFMTLYASWAVIAYLSWLMKADARNRLFGGWLLIIPGICIPLSLRYTAGYRFPLPLENFSVSMAITAGLLILSYILIMLPRSLNRLRRWAVVTFALAILARPFTYLIFYAQSDNRHQLNNLRTALKLTKPDERIMDGTSGLGLFRPTAYYYHYLHPGILLMLTEEEKGEKLLAALRKNSPKIIISDSYLKEFSPEVQDYIHSHYQPFRPGYPFLMRKPTEE